MKTIESIIDLFPLVFTGAILWLWIGGSLLLKEGKQIRPSKFWIFLIVVFGIIPPAIILSTLIIFYLIIF